jgi:hypothetical protein
LNTQNYVYVVICDNTVSSLGFDSFEKAEQWLFTDRNCTRLGNDWIYVDDGNLRYYIKEIIIK